jgi:cation diffusion facilitator family transporter
LLFKPWYWLDPALSILIVLFILKNCWSVMKEAAPILMNATPKNINIADIGKSLEDIPEICGVHYLHAWNVSSESIAFSAHIVVEDQLLSQTEVLAETIRHRLLEKFGINHVVLQFETATCGKGGLLCEMSCGGTKK